MLIVLHHNSLNQAGTTQTLILPKKKTEDQKIHVPSSSLGTRIYAHMHLILEAELHMPLEEMGVPNPDSGKHLRAVPLWSKYLIM